MPLLAGLVPANTLAVANTSPNTNKWTVESRLVSRRLGSVEFVAGAFYTHESSVYRTTIFLLDGTTKTQLPGPFGTLFRAGTLSNYEEYAGFGNLTFYLSDRLDVTGGLRVARNSDTSTTGAPLDGVAASSFFVPSTPMIFRSSETPMTYLGTLRWRPTDQISLFGRIATGYRPGGPQTNGSPPPGAQSSIGSDRTTNYEVGFKGNILDNRLSLDASIYHIDWRNIQLNTSFGGTVLGGNGGAAKVDGAELAATARPSRFLTVSGTFGYTNARLTSISPDSSATIGADAGDKLPLTPRITTSILADQRFPIADNVEATIGGTLRFQSDMPSSFAASTLNPNLKLPSFETIDLRAGVTFDKFTVQGRVENLLNRFGYVSATTNRLFPGQQLPTQGIVIRPRTVTLSVSTSF